MSYVNHAVCRSLLAVLRAMGSPECVAIMLSTFIIASALLNATLVLLTLHTDFLVEDSLFTYMPHRGSSELILKHVSPRSTRFSTFFATFLLVSSMLVDASWTDVHFHSLPLRIVDYAHIPSCLPVRALCVTSAAQLNCVKVSRVPDPGQHFFNP